MSVCSLITWLAVLVYAGGVILFIVAAATMILGLLALAALALLGGPAGAAAAAAIAPFLVGGAIGACVIAALMCMFAIGVLFFASFLCNPTALGLLSGFRGVPSPPGTDVLACIARCLTPGGKDCNCGPGDVKLPSPEDIFGDLPPGLRDALGFLLRQRDELKKRKEAIEDLIKDSTGKAKDHLEELRDAVDEEAKKGESALSSLIQTIPGRR